MHFRGCQDNNIETFGGGGSRNAGMGAAEMPLAGMSVEPTRGDKSFEGETAGRRNAGSCGVNPAELTRDGTKASPADVRVPTGEREPHCALLTGCIVATPLQTLTPGPAHTLSH